MVGQEPEDYRPRRAWVNGPDGNDDVVAEGTDTSQPTPNTPTTNTPTTNTSATSTDDETTLLPRTARARGAAADGGRPAVQPGRSDRDRKPASASSPGEDERTGLGQRTKIALVAAAVAAVAVIGLAVGYAVINLNDGNQAGQAGPTPSQVESPGDTSTPSTDPGVILSDISMLTTKDAELIDGKRTWTVALTQKGRSEESPQAACMSSEPVEGQPQPQQTIIRTLTASGKNPPVALHQADAYATPQQATQAFTLAAKALGGCVMDATYIDQGTSVTGVGDQVVGLILQVQAETTQFRTVVLNRTGRVVNIVDVAQDSDPAAIDGVAKSLGQITNDQCTAAVGLCSADVVVKDGPPPLGGDQPGFLAAADIPRVGKEEGVWSGDAPGTINPASTSQCEGVNFATAKGADERTARPYLLTDNNNQPDAFGIDEVILTMGSTQEAQALVKEVVGNLSDCTALTASVTAPKKIEGVGAQNTPIAGSTVTVTQKLNSSTSVTYRVGILSAGKKVVYTLLTGANADFDLTETQWTQLNVRAGERATQVK